MNALKSTDGAAMLKRTPELSWVPTYSDIMSQCMEIGRRAKDNSCKPINWSHAPPQAGRAAPKMQHYSCLCYP